MWLIDTGRADACTLGWAWQEFRYGPDVGPEHMVPYNEVPEFMYASLEIYPTQFHRCLGWLDYDAWRAWLTYRRIVG